MTSGSGSGSTEQPAVPTNKPLPSEVRTSAIRSAERPRSHGEIVTYRTMPYEKYLLTARWRSTRNRALKLAGYSCSRCQVTRDLQVHHLSYERLGDELDTDLEVLCRGCHLGHHVNEIETNLGVYFKIVEDVLSGERFTHLSDLIEAVKCRCAKLKIKYASGQVQTVIARMKDDRLSIQVPKKYAEIAKVSEPHEPLTRAEAAGLAQKYGAFAFMKHMPSVPRFTQKQADSLLALKKVYAPAVLDQIERCEEAERIAAEAEAKARRDE